MRKKAEIKRGIYLALKSGGGALRDAQPVIRLPGDENGNKKARQHALPGWDEGIVIKARHRWLRPRGISLFCGV
jgi:hypothetical protein